MLTLSLQKVAVQWKMSRLISVLKMPSHSGPQYYRSVTLTSHCNDQKLML